MMTFRVELQSWLAELGFPAEGIDAVTANDTRPLMTASRQGDAAPSLKPRISP